MATRTGAKVPPKKAPGKRDAKTGLSNKWAKQTIAGVRKKAAGNKK